MDNPEVPQTETSENNTLLVVGRTLVGLPVAGVIIFGLIGFIALFAAAFSVKRAVFMTVLLLPALGSIGMAILFLKVVLDRIRNKEDDYYSKNVER